MNLITCKYNAHDCQVYIELYCVKLKVLSSVGDIYFKSLLPNPLVASYSQPVNLTFLVVVGSDGISNNVEMLGVFHYDTFGNPTGQLRIPGNLGLSTQRFVLELGYAGASTAGEYAVCMYCNF